jgi:hypothetical protein
MKKIKFHSIYYRFILFIFAIFLTSINSIDRVNKVTFDFKWLKVEYLNICFFVISIALIWYFEFLTWKLYICMEGIYLKKIDLFVPFEEIDSVSHVWFSSIGSIKHRSSYSRKSLVIYRKNDKPIVVYNISLLALYFIKKYNSKVKINIMSATLATLFNVLVNTWFLYRTFTDFNGMINYTELFIYIIIFIIKSLIPFIMIITQNKIHGDYLEHDVPWYGWGNDKVIKL